MTNGEPADHTFPQVGFISRQTSVLTSSLRRLSRLWVERNEKGSEETEKAWIEIGNACVFMSKLLGIRHFVYR